MSSLHNVADNLQIRIKKYDSDSFSSIDKELSDSEANEMAIKLIENLIDNLGGVALKAIYSELFIDY
jgi:hypothetical protein